MSNPKKDPQQAELVPAPEATSLAPAIRQEPTVSELLAKVIDSPNAKDHVETLEKLLAMKERQEQREAERQFNVAFAKLQSELSPIQAAAEVPDKQGNVKYRFAPFDVIMREIRAPLQHNGFSVSFDSEFKDARMHVRCVLMHTGGFSRTTTSMHRIGSPFGANEAQADGATITLGKRYALCAALNIVIERDTDGNPDARNEGTPLNDEQQATLKEMVADAVKAGLIFDEKVFLRYAGASTYAEIGSNRYPELFRELNKKLGRT